MNTFSRGMRNAFRNKVRTISIVIILSLSVGLIIAMLAARAGVDAKIESIKSSTGNTITIAPAGFRGFEGGGSALTDEQMTKVAAIADVTTVTSSLSDRLSTDDTTNLTSAIEAGSLGGRFGGSSSSDSSSSEAAPTPPADDSSSSGDSASSRPNPMSSITITGVSDTSLASTFGGSTLTWTGGESLDASADTNNAVIGADLAEKNDLQVGDTFTAYGETLTVVGIYDAGTNFANNGVFVSLSALQRLSDQADAVTSATVTVDSLDNLDTVTSAIESELGDSADVTNSAETAETITEPLESVKTITLFSLIGAVVAGATIILLTMVMIVRERKREVGVMKAVGASNKSIVGQFIAEAVTLTTMALIVGFGIGIAAAAPLTSTLVETSSSSTTTTQGGPGAGGPGRDTMRASQQALENISSSVGVETIAYGIGATLVIAVLGSALPALMISKIKPAEAMRSE